jgi:hypothetical protein
MATAYKTNVSEEFLARSGQFLVERGYFHFSDVPTLVSLFEKDHESIAMRLLKRFIVSKLELNPTEKLPESLAILENAASLKKSWDHYLVSTPLFQSRLQQWKNEKHTDSETPPEPGSVVEDLISALLDIQLGTTDRLTVKLSLPHAPFLSNGQWNPANRQVQWFSEFDSRNESPALPPLCFAIWSEPAEAFQREHFGQVLLTDGKLIEYCSWELSLPPKQIIEWDKFLKGVSPADLKRKLDSFEPANTRDSHWFSIGRELIRAALEKKIANGSHRDH